MCTYINIGACDLGKHFRNNLLYYKLSADNSIKPDNMNRKKEKLKVNVHSITYKFAFFVKCKWKIQNLGGCFRLVQRNEDVQHRESSERQIKNHNEILSHTYKNGYHQKDHK